MVLCFRIPGPWNRPGPFSMGSLGHRVGNAGFLECPWAQLVRVTCIPPLLQTEDRDLLPQFRNGNLLWECRGRGRGGPVSCEV